MNSLPILLTTAAVVAISGIFVSATGNPNGTPPKNENTSTSSDSLNLPNERRVRPVPKPTPKNENTSNFFHKFKRGKAKGVSQPVPILNKAQNVTHTGSNVFEKERPKSTTSSPTPKTNPPPTLPTVSSTYIAPSSANSLISRTTTVLNPASKTSDFTDDIFQAALPPSLYLCISQFGNAGDAIKVHLQGFFEILYNKERSVDVNRLYKYGITSTVNNVSMELSSQPGKTDTKCNSEFLSSLDVFLRCYTAVFMVCDVVQRQYLLKNGFTKAIKDFTVFMNRDGKQFYKMLDLVRLKKPVRHQLCNSFIRYFQLLISSKMIADDFEEQIRNLFIEFELFLKNNKGKQDIKGSLVVGDVLTVGTTNIKDPQKTCSKYAYATGTNTKQPYIPSMMIAPFRIYITSMFQNAHRLLHPINQSNNEQVAAAVKSDLDLFWGFVEPAFKSFDDASKFCWDTLAGSSQGMSDGQMMNFTYLQYILNTHIFGNIEFALNHFEFVEQSKTLILEDSKTLLKAFFNFELARLNSPNSSSITLLPSINQPTPYDVISGPGISNSLNSIYEVMNRITKDDLLPTIAKKLSVMTDSLLAITNNLYFQESSEKEICLEKFKKIKYQIFIERQIVSSQNERTSQPPLSTPTPFLPQEPESVPQIVRENKQHEAQNSTEANGIEEKSFTSVLNTEAKESELLPMPLFVPPSHSTEPDNHQVPHNIYTLDTLQTVLPVALYRSISELPRAVRIKNSLLSFFCYLHSNIAFKTVTMKSMTDLITSHLENISMEASSQSDFKCNAELLSSLDAFLRCYTAVYMVCDANQRQYLIENGLTKSVNDFAIFLARSGQSFEELINFVVERKVETVTKEILYELGGSFIRYFKSLISTQLIAGEFESKVFDLCNVFEEFLKTQKSTQVIEGTVVFGDVLSIGFQNLKEVSPKYAFESSIESGSVYIPSMMISPFRVYITSLIQKYHRNTHRSMAEAAKSDVNLFWAIVEPAFKSFDDASQYSWKMMARTSKVISDIQLMHYSYLKYYLHTHILGSIELALNYFDCFKMNKALILNECTELLSAYFKLEMILLDSPCTTLLPSINQATPYDAISGPGISNIMNSIYNQMLNFLQHDIQPELAHEVSVMASVLSGMIDNLWFHESFETEIWSDKFLKIHHKLSSGEQIYLSQSGYDVEPYIPTIRTIRSTNFAIPNNYPVNGYYNDIHSNPAVQNPKPHIQYEDCNYNNSDNPDMGQSPTNTHGGSNNSSMGHPVFQAGISSSTSSQTSTKTQDGQSDSK